METNQSVLDMYSKGVTINKIHKLLKISHSKVIEILCDNGLTVNSGKYIPENIQEKIVALYQSGLNYKKIMAEIRPEFIIGQSGIFKCLRNHKVKIRKGCKYSINENFLDEINHDNAHFLGLMFSDGWISGKYAHLGLAEEDLDLLKQFKNIMSMEHPIYLTRKKGAKTKLPNGDICENTQSMHRITMVNKKILNDLQEIGLSPRKSWGNFGLPKIPKEFMKSFILGYFEGDGTISVYKEKGKNRNTMNFMILGQEKFIFELKDFIESEVGILLGISKRKKYKETHNQLYNLHTKKIGNLIKLYKWLYEDVSFAMNRKHNKWAFGLQDISKRPRKYEDCPIFKFPQNIE